MPEAGQNSTGKPRSDIEQLLVNLQKNLQHLDAQGKKDFKDFLARSMPQILQDPELLAQAVRSTSTLEGKKAAATSAVESAQNGGKKEVATSAVDAAGPTAQGQILVELQSTLGEFRTLIKQTIMWAGVIIVVVVLVVLFMSVQGELGAADLLVTIGIGIVATLAGYCLGAASLLWVKLKERRNP